MENDRILLRSWLESDAPVLFKYASDPEVGPRAGWPPHKSVEESLEIIRTVFNDATCTWAIILKETGEPIGAMGYGLKLLQYALEKAQPEAFAACDAGFPPKEKHLAPGQLPRFCRSCGLPLSKEARDSERWG